VDSWKLLFAMIVDIVVLLAQLHLKTLDTPMAIW